MQNTLEVAAPSAKPLGGWAEVRAADHVVRYVRFGAGAGTPVIILVPHTEEANIWPELFESLAVGRKVYIPDLPDTGECFAPQLRAFLDGLGLSSVTLVAPGSFGVPALEFALLEPHRLSGLVLVPRGGAEETGLTGALSTTTPKKETSVLLVRRDVSAAEAVELVSGFVAWG